MYIKALNQIQIFSNSQQPRRSDPKRPRHLDTATMDQIVKLQGVLERKRDKQRKKRENNKKQRYQERKNNQSKSEKERQERMRKEKATTGGRKKKERILTLE